ncbi:MAG: ParA family protein [Chloroflexi bacterium]|nr:ParA family protein [Ardenticatenaceae bacterium]MBL1129026.1 ParA family protein [Chloroflexota bacterium]NOG35105.1 ParA family protein [Chloroflexota bacterium]GIK59078.1 MAG: sporulation initiation inhibitor Soj [Chloroflexota bacterium]
MTKIYAIANQKGGVGKTTSVINICAYLAGSGRRVLLVDIDPQANATSGLGYDKYQLTLSTYHLLLESATLEAVCQSQAEFQLDILPAHPNLAGAEVELVNSIGREYRLKNVLEKVNGRYDYILIDCPPSLGLLTVNALTAARDGVLIPVQCEYLALEGLTQLTQTIELVQKYLNPQLQIRGLIMTMYDSRTNLSRQVVEEVRGHFPGKVFRTIIPRNVRLSEAPSFGQPISAYAPTSPGAIAYKVLTAELVKGDGA